jgi:transposase
MEEAEQQEEYFPQKTKGRRIANKEFKNLLKRNIYNAHIRGMQPSELARAFKQSEKTIDRYIKEIEQENYERRQAMPDEVAKSKLLDKVDEVVATCYQKMDEGGATAPLANAILRALELQGRIEGHIVNRVTGADGSGPVQVQAVPDRDEAIQEIMEKLAQAQQLRQVRVIEQHDE